MQITLLPPLLPADAVTAVGTARLTFTPGERILATVITTGLEGGSLLLGGREVLAGGDLRYPPGTQLQLEVVEGGRQPRLKLIAVQTEPVLPQPTSAPAPSSTPPVSPVGYGLAAAVLAAGTSQDLAGAAAALQAWLPALVGKGLLTPDQADALRRALAPIDVPATSASAPERAHQTEALARALAERVANGGAQLERRLADVIRESEGTSREMATRDLRSRLAVLAHLLENPSTSLEANAPSGLDGARDAVGRLQSALLAQQARAAAHLAHDGAVDLRVPLLADGRDSEMRLRITREAPDRGREQDAAPWRQVRLDLAFEALGRVHVRIGLVASHVQVEFLVEQPGAADRIEAGLGDLSSALEGAGFAQVLSRVVVDPVTACAPDVLPDLPRGAIVDADA